MIATDAYDALGRRVLKTLAGTPRHHAHDEQRRRLGENDGSGALSETVWLGDVPVAMLRGGQVFWIEAD